MYCRRGEHFGSFSLTVPRGSRRAALAQVLTEDMTDDEASALWRLLDTMRNPAAYLETDEPKPAGEAPSSL